MQSHYSTTYKFLQTLKIELVEQGV